MKLLKVLFISAFFVSSTFAFAQTKSSKANCQTTEFDRQVQVKKVQDGDIVVLDDLRRLRLIGINTPEIKAKNHNNKQYAQRAKQALHYPMTRSALFCWNQMGAIAPQTSGHQWSAKTKKAALLYGCPSCR